MKYISNEEGEKLLPCFSLCPLPAYKSSDWNYFYTKIGYKENTFKLEDIFSKAHAILLQNKTEYSVSETESIFLGVCQTVCKLRKVKAFVFEFSLALKRDWNINIYFHPKGSELLFFYSAVGSTDQMVTLNSKKTSDDIIGVDLSISETVTTVTSKENLDCKPYNIDTENHLLNYEYMTCLKKAVWLELRPRINCTIGGMSSLIEEENEIASIEECKDYKSAKNTREIIGGKILALFSNTSAYNCPTPCKTVSYNLNSIYYHKNSLLKEYYDHEDGEHFLLAIYYNTLVVEERTETLIYDATGMLASAGGNLGLMLGFSCLSIIFLAVDCIKTFCQHLLGIQN